MRQFVFLFMISFTAWGQKNQTLQTQRYGGIWDYEKKKGPIGGMLIYPETDSTILFYVDINLGPPAYNSGTMYDRAKVVNGRSIYSSTDGRCRWSMQFSTDRIIITTIDGADDCGFGGSLIIDGTLKPTSKVIPEYFENQEGVKTYFKSTPPEIHNK